MKAKRFHFIFTVFAALALSAALTPNAAHSAETEYTLEPIVVKAKSSFDSLGEDAYIPQKKINFEEQANRSGTLNSLEKSQIYPSSNQGYPAAAAAGLNLGGLSINDTQVSTLGVPLNLPQGGGPELAFFPSFLWSGASISTVPTLAGFSPQGVSGSIQFDLWTRTQVRDLKLSTTRSRVTANYDRNLQNFSLASKQENFAILAGMNQGRQKGPAGSMSYYFIRKPRSHFLFHILGTQQDGDSPGSKTAPSPNDRIRMWRIIPVLESHQEFEGPAGENDDSTSLVWESTLSADIQQLRFDSATFPSNDRIQQYGMENAFRWNNTQLAFTIRYLNYVSSTFGRVNDWPLATQLSQDFTLSPLWKMRLAGGGNSVSSTGFAPTARASFRYDITNEHGNQSAWFFELNSLAKMPNLTDRYYVAPFFRGNPALKPERASAVIAGYESKRGNIESTTTLKGEYRNQIQMVSGATMANSGNASLISLNKDTAVKIISGLTLRNSTLLTYSRIAQSNNTYPDLPYFSTLFGVTEQPANEWKINANARYMGYSKASGGRSHPAYFLLDSWVDYSPTKETTFTLGCENITDSRAEMVLDYPLPGRIAYLNARLDL